MRAVVQRVSRAEVRVGGDTVGAIGPGLLVFLGIGHGDGGDDIDWLVRRLVRLRVFEDGDGRMNRSLLEQGGEAMVISQFTLFGSLKKGNRPSFNRAAGPGEAVPLYLRFVECLSVALGRPVASGEFGADMRIDAANDGPVTLFVDTRERDF